MAASIGVAAAVLLGLWLKVEEARAPQEPPAVALGQPVDLGRTEITPLSLSLAPPEREGEPRRLLLRARLLNLTGETQSAVFGFPPHPPELAAAGVAWPEPEVTLDRDGELLWHLQPRLAERVTLAWRVPPGWQPGPVSLTFQRQTFKLRDNLYGKSSWLLFQPAGRMATTPEGAP
ncbi:hypothetical protein NM680_15565 [Paracoccus sp. PS-1]|uniref:hypothetical protein n=1 Tax=unclassified Paracoccus (in: a-proteobacteria) TaxID=2688777 RepID=UPI00048BEB9E|nr:MULTISPECIES: hypothetical protein [unclassified Paracoccus (in: a-proteobacteria)]MDQ7263213.1 hypothetical protein [Paracoccus sp. PS1]